MNPIKTIALIATTAVAAWVTAGSAANTRLPVSVLSSGPYEIVGNDAAAWILDTGTGRFRYCEKPKDVRDKPKCSEMQSFD
jgi:hypothetical protein